MIKVSILLLSVMIAFTVSEGATADKRDSSPSLRMELRRVELKCMKLQWAALRKENPEKARKKGWIMELVWVLPEFSGWEIYRCNDEPVRMMVEDSTGRKAPDVRDSPGDVDGRIMSRMDLPGWMPSAGARWVKVKGVIPAVVSCREAVTEPVTVKLEEGASVPLVLKGAGMGEDGRPQDVRVKLVVTRYGDEQPDGGRPREHKKVLRVKVEADSPVGIREIEWQTVTGEPVVAKDDFEQMRGILGLETIADIRLNLYFSDSSFPAALAVPAEPGNWGPKVIRKSWSLDPVKEGELSFSVRYSQDLQRRPLVIDHQVSVAGAVPGREGGNVEDGCSSSAVRQPLMDAGAVKPDEKRVSVMMDGLSIGSEKILTNNAHAVRMEFGVALAVKAPEVFGTHADETEQTLEVTDSTGHVLTPAVFDLTWLHSRTPLENEMEWTGIRGECPELASPGAEWLRLKGTLRVPVAVIKEGPVYELPLQKGIELQIPVPGRADTGGTADDVAALEEMPCRLRLKDLEKQNNGKMKVEISLEVENDSLELYCFELVDDQDALLKDVEVTGRSSSFHSKKQQFSWNHTFSIKNAVDMKKLRVRLKYKANRKTVSVPVDFKIGIGGPISQKTGNGK